MTNHWLLPRHSQIHPPWQMKLQIRGGGGGGKVIHPNVIDVSLPQMQLPPKEGQLQCVPSQQLTLLTQLPNGPQTYVHPEQEAGSHPGGGGGGPPPPLVVVEDVGSQVVVVVDVSEVVVVVLALQASQDGVSGPPETLQPV